MAWYNTQDWNNYRDQYAGITYPVNGDDIPVPFHTPITAIFPGTIYNEYVDASGATAIIQADNPTDLKGVPYYYYAHLDTFNVSTGQHVNPGDVVGLSGGQLTGGQHPASTQFSTGPHIMLGESKTGTIPYTFDTLTPDLNPEWMLQYARTQNIPTNISGATLLSSSTRLSGAINTCPTKGQKCTCPAGYSETSNALGDPICKNNSFPFDAKPCAECGSTDPLAQITNFFNSIQELTKWLSDPMRMIKLVFGVLLIAGAIFLLINPESQMAMRVAKGARKVGIR